MNALVIFALVIAATAAKPVDQLVAVTQDTLGNYKLKYAIDGISRVEEGDIYGNVAGGFAYLDPHGILRKTEFTAGTHGFNAAGADIPLPVHDTPEVALARAEHLAILHAEASRPLIPEYQTDDLPHHFIADLPLTRSSPQFIIPAPQPIHHIVQAGSIPDTPEVLAARAEHFAAHEAARSNLFFHH